MTTHTYIAVMRYARCIVAPVAVLFMAACGNGSSGGRDSAALSVTSVESNAGIKPGASLFGLSKIAVTGNDGNTSDIIASDIRISFNTAQDPPRPLIRDLAGPGEFWLPVILTRTSGTLSISVADQASVAIPLTLTPFATPDAPGAATRNFLKDSLSNTNAAIKDVLAGPRLPDLAQAVVSAMEMTQQELNWVTNTMRNGAAIMATRKDGTPVKMTTDDLRALDQMVLHTEALKSSQGTVPPAAQLSPWRKIVDSLIPGAFAQTNDNAAFIRAAKATGGALRLAANMVPGVGDTAADALHRGADAQATSLNMAGLYAAHYGNGLATMQTLPNLTFTKPVDAVHMAVSVLFAGVVNEIILPDLDSLAQDNAVGLVSNFMAKANSAAVENIVMDNVIIFQARSIGIDPCPSGQQAVADPAVDSISCVNP